MYCRETTDRATEHISGLPRLKNYFASYTRITDRSMEILSGIDSLVTITFYGCPAVTDAGVKALARLPNLKELNTNGPNISPACGSVFRKDVRIDCSE
jgi:hypothetical protein